MPLMCIFTLPSYVVRKSTAHAQLLQVVARRAKHMLAHTWHPYSARSSKRAAAVLGDLMAYMPADSPVLQVSLPLMFHYTRHAIKYG